MIGSSYSVHRELQVGGEFLARQLFIGEGVAGGWKIQDQVGDLDLADTAGALAGDKLPLVDLVLVARLFWLGDFGGHEGNRVKQNIFWFDISEVVLAPQSY